MAVVLFDQLTGVYNPKAGQNTFFLHFEPIFIHFAFEKYKNLQKE